MLETAELTILALDRDGEGLTADGQAVFAALPGERVRARREGARWATDEVLEESAERAAPICPLFGRCGGCAAQHMAPSIYREWKRQRVVAALGKASLEVEVAPLVEAHGRGRRRAIFHARFSADAVIEVGFMRRRSHAIVEIAGCPLLSPELAGAPAIARELARAAASAGKPLDIQLTASAAGVDADLRGLGAPSPELAKALVRRAEALDLARLSVHGEVLIERRAPALIIDGVTLVPPPGGFLQATEAGEDAIAALALPPLKAAKRVADLFCGCGAFALRLARRHRVLALDADRAAIDALAQASARAPDRRPIAAERRDLFQRPLQREELDGFEGVLFDPPRAGAEAQARALAASAVPVVVAVSCNAETFARDARLLAEGGYRLRLATPIDQFLYSPHVEIVGVFERKSPSRRRKGLLG